MIMERIQEAKAGIRSLTGATDTTTAPARMVIQKWSEHLLSLKERFSVSEQAGLGLEHTLGKRDRHR